MPDWVSHILTVLILAEIFPIKKKSLMVLGVLLPDFLTKVYLLNYFVTLPDWLTFSVFAFHRFVPIILVGLIISPLFKKNMFLAAIMIPAGSVLHILTDRFFGSSLGFVFPEHYWIDMIVLFIIYFVILAIKKIVQVRKNENKK